MAIWISHVTGSNAAARTALIHVRFVLLVIFGCPGLTSDRLFILVVEMKIGEVKTSKSELLVVGLASNRVPQDLDGFLNLGTVYTASA